MEERDALLFSDGSLTVFAEGRPMHLIKEEREDSDRNAPVHEWTKIVRVKFEVVEVISDPSEAVSTAADAEQALAELLPHIPDANNTANPGIAKWHDDYGDIIRAAATKYGREHFLAVMPDITAKSRRKKA